MFFLSRYHPTAVKPASPVFVVSLRVGALEFRGEGATAQAAKHAAAGDALRLLKVSERSERMRCGTFKSEIFCHRRGNLLERR